jgi:uncharacterized protein with gpF-like domain
MATVNKFRQMYARQHRRYEREALKVLFQVFKEWGEAIQWDIMTEFNYKAVVELNVENSLMYNAYIKIYTGIGLEHGDKIGKSINVQLKEFTFASFSRVFQETILSWIRLNVAQNITNVTQTYKDYVNGIITSGLANGETIQEIAIRLQRITQKRNFYRWQAERIARTETTTASNHGASVASGVSGFVMQKVWISTLDARTRRPPKSEYNHLIMDEVRVGQNDRFNVQGDLLRYPADPNGQPENIINCRCTVAIVPARDAEGDLIAV